VEDNKAETLHPDPSCRAAQEARPGPVPPRLDQQRNRLCCTEALAAARARSRGGRGGGRSSMLLVIWYSVCTMNRWGRAFKRHTKNISY